MTRVADIFEPDKKNSKLYGDLFENVYMKLYNKLKPLYEEIREVTGYPPFYSNEG
jgi:hypothetical protein